MEEDAAMIQAYLLPGGGCAESFKKFNGNNISDTFNQRSAILALGCQMPLIKVGRDDALGFMSTTLHHLVMSTTELCMCLLLPYEQALGSDDVANLVGIKVSDEMNNNDLLRLIDIVNPTNKPGRITIIPRMGPDNVEVKLPHLVRPTGESLILITDLMHARAHRRQLHVVYRHDNLSLYLWLANSVRVIRSIMRAALSALPA